MTTAKFDVFPTEEPIKRTVSAELTTVCIWSRFLSFPPSQFQFEPSDTCLYEQTGLSPQTRTFLHEQDFCTHIDITRTHTHTVLTPARPPLGRCQRRAVQDELLRLRVVRRRRLEPADKRAWKTNALTSLRDVMDVHVVYMNVPNDDLKAMFDFQALEAKFETDWICSTFCQFDSASRGCLHLYSLYKPRLREKEFESRGVFKEY